MKRILSILITLIVTMSVCAQSYSGRTYKSTLDKGVAVLTMTLKFTSDTQGMIIMSATHMETEKHKFSYKVNGDKIDIVMVDGSKTSINIDHNDTLIMYLGSKYKVTFSRVGKSKSQPNSKIRKSRHK